MSDQTRQVNQTANNPASERTQVADNATFEKKPTFAADTTPLEKKPSAQEIRFENLLKQAGNSNVGVILEKLQPAFDVIQNALATISPYVFKAWHYGNDFYNSLPLDILYALVGLLLVFFGGVYTLLIAAVETFYATGYVQARDGVLILKEEFELIWTESKKDDALDEDHDGVADVKQITVYKLAQRKFLLFLQTCKDPQRVVDIFYRILSSLISVIAVLKVEFAKVISLGNMIGQSFIKPASYILIPALGYVISAKYQKWIPAIIDFICKSIAISIAWFIQRVISSVQSAIRGGLLFSRRLLKFLKEKGYFTSYNEDDYFDEALGWFVAVIGIYFQISVGFGLPFPLNILLFPLNIIENYITWAVSN